MLSFPEFSGRPRVAEQEPAVWRPATMKGDWMISWPKKAGREWHSYASNPQRPLQSDEIQTLYLCMLKRHCASTFVRKQVNDQSNSLLQSALFGLSSHPVEPETGDERPTHHVRNGQALECSEVLESATKVDIWSGWNGLTNSHGPIRKPRNVCLVSVSYMFDLLNNDE